MTYEQSPEIGQLAAALARAQGAMGGALKNEQNYYKRSYADLKSVWEACREHLAQNDLALIQTVTSDGDTNRIGVITTLTHKSGEWVRGAIFVTPEKTGPQAAGSVITYLRRYGLAAMVGVYQEDDDAESATDRNAPSPSQPKQKRRAATQATPKSNTGLGPKAQAMVDKIQEIAGKDALTTFYNSTEKARENLPDNERSYVVDAYHAKLDGMDEVNRQDDLPF